MRRLVAWISGLAGGIAAYRLLRRRRRPAHEETAAAGPDPRAEALRAKLEETPEPEPDDADATGPEERRRRVHEEARAAVDEMRRGIEP